MVAARPIKAGEPVLEDLPLTYGPCCLTGPTPGSLPVCLGCYRPVDGTCVCSRCGWPVCGDECSRVAQHRDNECRLFEDSGYRPDVAGMDYGRPQLDYAAISPIRHGL